MTARHSKSVSASLSRVHALASSRTARTRAVGCASALGVLLGSASAAHAGGTLPMALTSYLDTSANVAHVFYQATDGGVYDLSAPLSQAAQGNYTCTQPLPSMHYNMAGRTWGPVPGAATPGGGLVSAFDGTTGYLYYIGDDGGVWAASGNPPTAVTATSINVAVGGGAATPAGQPQRWTVPGGIGLAPLGYEGVTSAATLAAAVSGGQQFVFYQGATSTKLQYLAYTGLSWFYSSAGTAAPNALNGRGLAATWSSTGPAVVYDDTAGNADVLTYGCHSSGTIRWCGFSAQDTLNIEFQGFLSAASIFQNGSSGIEVVGPDQSTTVPAIDTATNADATGAWTTGGINVPVLQAGPSLLLSTGSSATAPNGLSSWLYYIGSDTLIYSSNGTKLLHPRLCHPSCDGWPATSTANTAFTPLTGFYSPVDANVYLYFLDTVGNVYQIILSQSTAAQTDSGGVITPSACPRAMN